MLIYYNAHHYIEFQKNRSKSWERAVLLLFRAQIFAKYDTYTPKNVPENLYMPLLSVNGTPLPCTKHFKSWSGLYFLWWVHEWTDGISGEGPLCVGK